MGEAVGCAEALGRARESFERMAWGDAFARLSAADRAATLAADDLERFAVAAYLAGRDADSEDAWSRAHQRSVTAEDWGRACAGVAVISANSIANTPTSANLRICLRLRPAQTGYRYAALAFLNADVLVSAMLTATIHST